MQSRRPVVVVAGANGFIGRAVVAALAERWQVIGLSRGASAAERGVGARRCDLMRLDDAMAGLAGAELAVYLVHSMMPSDRLVQAEFQDLDLLAADNFARAAAASGVRQIVYLGGLAPTEGEPSAHIASRIEIEAALGAYGVPVTTLRAGIVFGPGGSSSRIVFNLARRLPVMVCPRWTATPTQPIALEDAVTLVAGVLDRAETFGQVYDIAGPERMTYREMMTLVGEAVLGRKPVVVGVPVLTPALSRLWVSVVTGAPKALVEPLIGSLAHPMLPRDRRLQEALGVPGRSMREVLPEALAADADAGTPRAFEGPKDARTRRAEAPRVRSIQRLALPRGAHASDVAERYFAWLRATFGVALDVGWRAGAWHLGLKLLPAPLLVLEPTVRAADRVVMRIAGGLLANGEGGAGTFEIREVLGGKAVLAAIADYTPRLPWWLYLASQAQAHRLVMALFGRHLAAGEPA
ncbi:MAG: NAD-dependent epimerase/dehydratase family protein [Deltaproteobacteria bacterium]|nr:NAD-dependent epimerase/dehydratase family protein [Deltaproteobacteria bacterium]